MASVWVARLRGKRAFESLVAIKTILPQHAGERDFEEMFLNEARIVAGIRHPNVASVLDLGEERGILYLVFEWIDGDQLSKLRRTLTEKGKKFPVGLALRIMADVCAGLHAAHELTDADGWPLSIVHRDVSPQNILVSTTGGVKVIDFGIAKALDRAATDTGVGKVKGKPFYMAPEQISSRNIDRRADLWSAGVVLYQLLAERLPFEGDNNLATLALVASCSRPPPLPPEIPSAVAEVVGKALTADVNARFQTAAEMHRAIEGALARVYGPVTSADVASFINEHLARSREARHKVIAAALEVLGHRGDPGAEFDHALPSSRLARPLGLSSSSCSLPRVDLDAGDLPQVEKEGRPEPSSGEAEYQSMSCTAIDAAAARGREARSRLSRMRLAMAAGLAALLAAAVGVYAQDRYRREEVPASPASPLVAAVSPGPAQSCGTEGSPAMPSASFIAPGGAEAALAASAAEASRPRRWAPPPKKRDPREVFGARK